MTAQFYTLRRRFYLTPAITYTNAIVFEQVSIAWLIFSLCINFNIINE